MSLLERKTYLVRMLIVLCLAISIGSVFVSGAESQTFTSPGTVHSFDVSSADKVEVTAKGAGGGSGADFGNWDSSGNGGDGGGFDAVFDVSEFDTLEIWVGEGGKGGRWKGQGGKISGGWGRSKGGGSYSAWSGQKMAAGTGGGSTEVVGIKPDGTRVFLAAADAGGGGLGSGLDSSIGGGGGARGGAGGNGYGGNGIDGEDAEGSGKGGGGGDGDGKVQRDPGADGGYELNSKYSVKSSGSKGGHSGSGGTGDSSDGEDGEVSISVLETIPVYMHPESGLASKLTAQGPVNGTLVDGTEGYHRQRITFLNTTSGREFLKFTGLFDQGDVDLRDMNIEATDSEVAVDTSGTKGMSSEHTLFLPNNNNDHGVRVCPDASSISDVHRGCSGEVTFNAKELGETKDGVTLQLSDGVYKISGVTGSGAELLDPPNIVIHSPNSSTIGETGVWLNVSADKKVDEWRYNFDGDPTLTFDPNITISNISHGRHRVTVWAEDAAGNENQSTVWFYVDLRPPEISCDGCISPQPAEVGQDVSITPEVTDDGFGVKSVDICLNRQCSEILDCDSADCTTDFDTPENRDIYVRAVDRGGNSITERIGGLFVGKGLERPCSANEQCISGNCEGGECQPQRIPPEVEFSQGGGEIDSIKMSILDTVKVNISVSNFLPFSDSITLKFRGRASKGVVAGNISETSGVDCNRRNSVCNVSVQADSNRDVETTIQGISVGSGALQVKAVSTSTSLEAEDVIQINTRPRTPEGPVSAPGMTLPYISALLLLSSLYLLVKKR